MKIAGLALLAADSGPVYSALVGIDPTTIVFTLVNTVLIMLMYRFFLHKKVVAILEKRKEAINAEMDAATAAKEQAQKVENEYKEKLTKTKEEAQQIISAATARAQAKEEEILAEANQSAASIRERAQESITQEKKRAINEIKNQISELVILTAEAVTEKEINEDDNKALIDSFLVNIGNE